MVFSKVHSIATQIRWAYLQTNPTPPTLCRIILACLNSANIFLHYYRPGTMRARKYTSKITELPWVVTGLNGSCLINKANLFLCCSAVKDTVVFVTLLLVAKYIVKNRLYFYEIILGKIKNVSQRRYFSCEVRRSSTN